MPAVNLVLMLWRTEAEICQKMERWEALKARRWEALKARRCVAMETKLKVLLGTKLFAN